MKWISVNTNGRYAVNRAGEVKNLETNKKLKPSFNKAGGFRWMEMPLPPAPKEDA